MYHGVYQSNRKQTKNSGTPSGFKKLLIEHMSLESLNIPEMQFKIILRYHHTVIKIAFLKKMIKAVTGTMDVSLVRTQTVPPLQEIIWCSLNILY